MTEKEKTAMEALDEGISDAYADGEPQPSDSPEAAAGEMPVGHDQIDSDMTPAQIRRVRANMYFFHGLVGVVLLPFALLLRAGRWSMRTLIAHHNGWEFGGF